MGFKIEFFKDQMTFEMEHMEIYNRLPEELQDVVLAKLYGESRHDYDAVLCELEFTSVQVSDEHYGRLYWDVGPPEFPILGVGSCLHYYDVFSGEVTCDKPVGNTLKFSRHDLDKHINDWLNYSSDMNDDDEDGFGEHIYVTDEEIIRNGTLLYDVIRILNKIVYERLLQLFEMDDETFWEYIDIFEDSYEVEKADHCMRLKSLDIKLDPEEEGVYCVDFSLYERCGRWHECDVMYK